MIYYFNPGHETAVSNSSKYYTAPANIANMQSDLAYLPAYCCTDNDYVLLKEKLPLDFNTDTGVIPHTFTKEDIPDLEQLLKNQQVCLWGISPQSLHFFDTLSKDNLLNLSLPVWSDDYKYFSSRRFASDCLSFVAEQRAMEYIKDIIPQFFSSLNDIEDYISQNTNQRFLAKAPYSSSGRGLLWLPMGELTRTERQILHGHIKKQGAVSIEKALSKRIDFAMEFLSHNGQIDYLGLSLFKTNEKGAYISNCLDTQSNLKNKIIEYIPIESFDFIREILISFFTDKLASLYNGYIGVDMMIYEEAGEYRIQPCIEINMRNNMGILSMNVMDKVVAKGSKGIFCIDFNSNGIMDSDRLMKSRYPTLFENNKLVSGYLSLCPIYEKTKYRAYILIERE